MHFKTVAMSTNWDYGFDQRLCEAEDAAENAISRVLHVSGDIAAFLLVRLYGAGE